METSSIRVLVVEDSEKFRKFICSTLGERPELKIVGEDSDGLQALQSADKLQPDLILLDIGLPSLNGIEVARQTLKLSPKSKILFVSQESSADLVQEALALGALGYVVKWDAGKELLTAVEAVVQGRQYLSSRLTIAPTRRTRKPSDLLHKLALLLQASRKRVSLAATRLNSILMMELL